MRKIQIAISSDLCISLSDWHEIWQAAAAATETLWLVSYGGKTIPKWRTAAIFKIDISPYLNEKSSDFNKILYTAADFELDERHVIKNEKVALDRLRVRQNVFLVYLIVTSLLFISNMYIALFTVFDKVENLSISVLHTMLVTIIQVCLQCQKLASSMQHASKFLALALVSITGACPSGTVP